MRCFKVDSFYSWYLFTFSGRNAVSESKISLDFLQEFDDRRVYFLKLLTKKQKKIKIKIKFRDKKRGRGN